MDSLKTWYNKYERSDFMKENQFTEFKQELTDTILKDIIAFLNTGSGTIFLGYDDNFNLVGLPDVKKTEEALSNKIKNLIEPDCSLFVLINPKTLDGKDYLTIQVTKANDVYYLREKGITKSCFVRVGSCSIAANPETVKDLLIRSKFLFYESILSPSQDLTFNYAKNVFLSRGIDLTSEEILKNLKIKNNDGLYTNLGLILSDNNPFEMKIAVYESEAKKDFLDRKTFQGSLLEVYDKTIEFLKLNSAVRSVIKSSIREDIEDWPEFIMREIVLNSLIHRDYSVLSPNIINIYLDSSIEVINYGCLYNNISLQDALSGLSVSRNPILQSIGNRLGLAEAIGSGLRRVSSYYTEKGLNLNIKALPSSFIVTIPKMNDIGNLNTQIRQSSNMKKEDIILEYLKQVESASRKELEELIQKGRTAVSRVLTKLIAEDKVESIGSGPSQRYKLKENISNGTKYNNSKHTIIEQETGMMEDMTEGQLAEYLADNFSEY